MHGRSSPDAACDCRALVDVVAVMQTTLLAVSSLARLISNSAVVSSGDVHDPAQPSDLGSIQSLQVSFQQPGSI